MAKDLQEIAKSLPNSPGIYQFIDGNGDILYVGKAKNLESRIKSYFLKEIGRGPAIDIMVNEAADIKFIETESEIEAVLLEANVINKLKPRYNVRLRDDKSFLVIKITKPVKTGSEKDLYQKFSCVELIRFKNVDFKDKSADYFGPYPAGLLLKKSLHYLRKIFPYRDCSRTKFSTYRKKGRPCIYGDVRVCTGPCVDWVNQVEYQKNINYLKKFLRGEKRVVVKDLQIRMKELSQNKKFEEAALLRDKIGALDHLKDVAVGLRDDFFSGESLLFKRIECYDISNIAGEYSVGSMIVFENGKKNTDEYRRFKIKTVAGANDLAMLKEVLTRRFKNADWPKPDLVLIDGGQNQLNVAKEVLQSMKIIIPVASIAKGPKRDKNDFFFSNTFLAKYAKGNISLQNVLIAARDEAHRFAIAYYRSLHKKGMFK